MRDTASPPPPQITTSMKLNCHTIPLLSNQESLPSYLAAYLFRVVIPINVITVGVAAWTLYVDPMTLQDCCFFEKSK